MSHIEFAAGIRQFDPDNTKGDILEFGVACAGTIRDIAPINYEKGVYGFDHFKGLEQTKQSTPHYDCWHKDHETVTTEMIIDNLLANVETAKQIVRSAIQNLPLDRSMSPAYKALEKSIATNPNVIPEETKQKLELLIGKYL